MKGFHTGMAALCILISGCGIANEKIDPEEMYIKAAELRKLAVAVESTVQYKEPIVLLENEELLRMATEHNPALLEGFRRYVLKAKNANRHSVVLLCDASGKKALLEDTGCTGKLDVHHWKVETISPCEFSIKLEEVCQ
jgi:hypothetical protein